MFGRDLSHVGTVQREVLTLGTRWSLELSSYICYIHRLYTFTPLVYTHTLCARLLFQPFPYIICIYIIGLYI